MAEFDIEKYFRNAYEQEKSSAIATLKTLIQFLKEDNSTTAIGLGKNVRQAIEKLKLIDARTEVESVAEIYFRFITLSASKFDEFNALKQELSRRSELYMNKVMNSRKELAKNGQKFLTDGCKILIHSYSRAVYETLKEALKLNKKFEIFVTQSKPDKNGLILQDLLKKECGIDVTLILDSAVGYIMDRVDLVLVGAEGVAESGGIINKIGTYQMAICAKAHNKPFYVLVESYKFIRLYPLSQSELPQRLKWRNCEIVDKGSHPLVDYTPPNYITFLLTDLGTLTTAAVCDTLLQLYM